MRDLPENLQRETFPDVLPGRPKAIQMSPDIIPPLLGSSVKIGFILGTSDREDSLSLGMPSIIED